MAYNCNKQALHNIKGICHTYGRCSAEWNVTQCYLYGAKLMPFEIDEVMKTAQKVSLIGQAYLSKHSKSELKRKKKMMVSRGELPFMNKILHYLDHWQLPRERGRQEILQVTSKTCQEWGEHWPKQFRKVYRNHETSPICCVKRDCGWDIETSRKSLHHV